MIVERVKRAQCEGTHAARAGKNSGRCTRPCGVSKVKAMSLAQGQMSVHDDKEATTLRTALSRRFLKFSNHTSQRSILVF